MEKPETVIAQVRQKLGRRGSWASISHDAAPWHRYITPVRPSSGMNTQPAWRAFVTIVPRPIRATRTAKIVAPHAKKTSRSFLFTRAEREPGGSRFQRRAGRDPAP